MSPFALFLRQHRGDGQVFVEQILKQLGFHSSQTLHAPIGQQTQEHQQENRVERQQSGQKPHAEVVAALHCLKRQYDCEDREDRQENQQGAEIDDQEINWASSSRNLRHPRWRLRSIPSAFVPNRRQVALGSKQRAQRLRQQLVTLRLQTGETCNPLVFVDQDVGWHECDAEFLE